MAIPELVLTPRTRAATDTFVWAPPASVMLPTGTVQGGAAFGAAIAAMEAATARAARWASCQFLAPARVGEPLELEVTVRAAGRSSAQASCIITAAGTAIGHVTAALGTRDPGTDGTWIKPPPVRTPAECEPHVYFAPGNGDLGDIAELRSAGGPVPDTPGRSVLWARGCTDPSRTPTPWDLSVIADFAPMVLRDVLQGPYIGTSLDNEIRMGHPVPSEWVLVEVTITHVADGFAHLLAHLWSQDGGSLMATVAQTCTLREAVRGR